MTAGPTQTGLIVPVLELDDFVQRWRPFDAVPLVGVPAHVTVLFPWVPPPVPNADLQQLDDLVRRFGPFDFTLAEVRRFGAEVVYVAPEPPGSFAALTDAVVRTWPHHPPYEGEIEDPIPHLTLIHGGAPEHMAAAGDEVEELLPISCRAEELWLMVGGWDPPVWRIAARYRFGEGATTIA